MTRATFWRLTLPASALLSLALIYAVCRLVALEPVAALLAASLVPQTRRAP